MIYSTENALALVDLYGDDAADRQIVAVDLHGQINGLVKYYADGTACTVTVGRDLELRGTNVYLKADGAWAALRREFGTGGRVV